jgi:hypothetical protein
LAFVFAFIFDRCMVLPVVLLLSVLPLASPRTQLLLL